MTFNGLKVIQNIIKPVKGAFNAHRTPAKQHIPGMPTRHGISQHVLNSAERLMKEYQPDLDYLKDR